METLAQTLEREIAASPEGPIPIGAFLKALGPRGPAALMVVLPLPFCLPVQIPGLSIPFGLLLVLVGAQLGWRDQLWCPRWLAQRTIAREHMLKIASWVGRAESHLARFVSPRFTVLTSSRWAHRVLGVLVILLASVLCIPIPLPFSNMLVAVPLCVLGLALLAQDGLALLVGLLLTILGFAGLAGLSLLAFEELSKVAML